MLNKIKQLKKNKKGFTLIELVVVLVIIAILAAITVPVVTGYIEDANDARYVSEARSIYLVVQAEEARERAKGTETLNEAFYTGLVETANKKVKDTSTGKEAITVTAIKNDSVGKYTIEFTSGDSKNIKATIEANKEIQVEKVKTGA